jgi:hypothetical protein
MRQKNVIFRRLYHILYAVKACRGSEGDSSTHSEPGQ